MSGATFACPDLTTFCRLDELGLEVTGQRLEPGRAVLACRVVEPDEWCRRCGCLGSQRDTVIRRLAHEPFGWRPTLLEVTVRRYRCAECAHVWRQDTSKAAAPRSKLSRRALRWALEGLVVAHLTVARIADGLGVAWNTANDAVLAEGKRILIAHPHRLTATLCDGHGQAGGQLRLRRALLGTAMAFLAPTAWVRSPGICMSRVPGRSSGHGLRHCMSGLAPGRARCRTKRPAVTPFCRCPVSWSMGGSVAGLRQARRWHRVSMPKTRITPQIPNRSAAVSQHTLRRVASSMSAASIQSAAIWASS